MGVPSESVGGPLGLSRGPRGQLGLTQGHVGVPGEARVAQNAIGVIKINRFQRGVMFMHMLCFLTKVKHTMEIKRYLTF